MLDYRLYCRVLKTLYNKDWFMPSNILHRDLYILNIEDIFNLSILKIAHKHRNKQLPCVFNKYFITRLDIHNRPTRHSNKLDIIKVKTNYGNKTLRVNGARLYNELPANITDYDNIITFAKKVRKYFIDKY